MEQNSLYSLLNPESRQIRLLTLLCSPQDDQPIHCNITISDLDDVPKYEALSYVWGNVVTTAPIYIGPLRQQFNATTNLERALSHLRYPDQDRILWVDAICINQEDDDEKSRQVRMMRMIYEGAACVVAWLGPETPVSKTAIHTLELLANDRNLHWTKGRSNRNGESIDTEQSLGLRAWFQECEWWRRIWTLQEYVSAKKLVFVNGRFSIARSTMTALADHRILHSNCCPATADDFSTTDGQDTTTNRIFNEIIRAEDLSSERKSHSYIAIAAFFRQRRATRPEDKVFGLVGLFKDFDDSIIAYGRTAAQVYEQSAQAIIRTTGSLDILSHVFHPNSRQLLQPSWVPNWAAHIPPTVTHILSARQDIFRLYRASGDQKCSMISCNGDQMAINGVLWDTITCVGEARDDVFRRSNAIIFNDWHKMSVDGLQKQDYVSGGTLENAFWRSLCMDVTHSLVLIDRDPGFQFDPTRAQDSVHKVYEMWWGLVQRNRKCDHEEGAQSQNPLQVTEEVVLFDQEVSNSTTCRTFFISEKGYIGLAPAIAVPGDKIAVLFGGKVPYIIRREESEERLSTWTYIGDSYVHGIMDGEVIKYLESGQVESEVLLLE